jgi:hypothetical protein
MPPTFTKCYSKFVEKEQWAEHVFVWVKMEGKTLQTMKDDLGIQQFQEQVKMWKKWLKWQKKKMGLIDWLIDWLTVHKTAEVMNMKKVNTLKDLNSKQICSYLSVWL